MSLSVKAPEAHRLAEAIANATGETITRAVIRSLQERLERLGDHSHNPEKMMAGIWAIAERASAHINALNRANVDHGDFLYDEHGLPK